MAINSAAPPATVLNGSGSSSYIDDVILVDTDTTGSGLLNERMYYVQNWRSDVVAMLDASGEIESRIDYAAYGEAIAKGSPRVDR